jgi:hypothetical protein
VSADRDTLELAGWLERESMQRLCAAIGDQPVVPASEHACRVADALRAAGVYRRRAEALLNLGSAA